MLEIERFQSLVGNKIDRASFLVYGEVMRFFKLNIVVLAFQAAGLAEGDDASVVFIKGIETGSVSGSKYFHYISGNKAILKAEVLRFSPEKFGDFSAGKRIDIFVNGHVGNI